MWVISSGFPKEVTFQQQPEGEVSHASIWARAAGRGKSEKRDVEEEEAKGDLGSVIHSYTISTRFLEIK